MANPASVYCVEQGGDPQIKKTAEGEVGYCLFPDGRVVEQWDFYRASLE
jgi:putative hemolysin